LSKVVEISKKDGSWNLLDDIDELIIPPDLGKALACNKEAIAHFSTFSDSLKRQILWWIASAKRTETRNKRIAHVIDSAEHKQRPL
jgi:uncharacterized protein YdeI (YjbR/CyaY-like superfamily)